MSRGGTTLYVTVCAPPPQPPHSNMYICIEASKCSPTNIFHPGLRSWNPRSRSCLRIRTVCQLKIDLSMIVLDRDNPFPHHRPSSSLTPSRLRCHFVAYIIPSSQILHVRSSGRTTIRTVTCPHLSREKSSNCGGSVTIYYTYLIHLLLSSIYLSNILPIRWYIESNDVFIAMAVWSAVISQLLELQHLVCKYAQHPIGNHSNIVDT